MFSVQVEGQGHWWAGSGAEVVQGPELRPRCRGSSPLGAPGVRRAGTGVGTGRDAAACEMEIITSVSHSVGSRAWGQAQGTRGNTAQQGKGARETNPS